MNFSPLVLPKLPPYGFSRKQHAYANGKSVDTAQYYLVGCIEGLALKEYKPGIFLAIEDAFNNILTEFVLEAHQEMCLQQPIVKLVKSLLRNRIIFAQMSSAHITRNIARGTP